MEQIVAPNNFRLGIGQERKRVSLLPAMSLARFHRINTDPEDTDATLLKFRKPFLKTPQLGVTKYSPSNRDRRSTTQPECQVTQEDL